MSNAARQVVLDTETTGFDYKNGHRIIEIGCVEMVNRKLTNNHYHTYINPEFPVDPDAVAVHGLTNEFLADKPVFKTIANEFLSFIKGAELIIHNAPFDVPFINHEFSLLPKLKLGTIADHCSVLDSLELARKMHPGQKNSLDALCKRYGVDNSHRELHGALLDSEILADVYLLMTGGQTSFNLASRNAISSGDATAIRRVSSERKPLKIVKATVEELNAHEERLDLVMEKGGACLWRD